MFHHLDVEGTFTDGAARFYAASVLVVLQHLHNKVLFYLKNL